MSTTQKLEMSREIRQWIGTVIGLGSAAIFAWMIIDPEGFERTVKKIQSKFKKKKKTTITGDNIVHVL